MEPFKRKPSALGPDHSDYVCTADGCSWHKVVHEPTAGARALSDLREHALEHLAVA